MGLIVGTTMWIHPQIVSRESSSERMADAQRVETLDLGNQRKIVYMTPAEKSTSTTVPFFKNSELDYRDLIPVEGHLGDTLGWLLYVLIAVCIITAVSNEANLTDGLDGLAAEVSDAI